MAQAPEKSGADRYSFRPGTGSGLVLASPPTAPIRQAPENKRIEMRIGSPLVEQIHLLQIALTHYSNYTYANTGP